MKMERIRQLLQGCGSGDMQVAQALLEDGMNVDSADEDGITPLQMAAAHGHVKLVCLLIVRGAALDHPNAYGWTPLMHAVRHGHAEVVALLLQNKAKVNVKNKLGASVLVIAARSSHLSSVRLLLDAGADINGDGSADLSPLMVAAHQGCDSVAKILIDRGANVNQKTLSSGLTPLMYAAVNGHKTTVQVLLERGADVNFTNCCDKTALDIAVLNGKRSVQGYLDRKTKSRPICEEEDEAHFNIIDAIKVDNIEQVKALLIKDHAQKNLRCRDDNATPLMFAAMLGHCDIVKFLIESGSDLDAKDTISGWTALMQAIFHGKNTIAKQLLDAGADVNLRANNGCSAFELASLVEDADADLIRTLAAKTLQMKKGSDLRRVTYRKPCSTGNIPHALLTCEDVADTGLKMWWTRMSNRFRNLKLGRTLRLAPIPAELTSEVQNKRNRKKKNRTTKKPVKCHSEKQSAAVSWEPKVDASSPGVKSDETATAFTIVPGFPASLLTSDAIKPVIPPLLPMPSFDSSMPNRSGMPAGKVFPAISSSFSAPVQPLRATRLLSTSVGSSLCSPNGSIHLGTPSPQSSNDSGQLKTLLFSTGKKSSSSAQTLSTPVSISLSSHVESSESSHQRTASCPGGMLLSSLTKSPVKALNFSAKDYSHPPDTVKSGLSSDRFRSASSRSSKSSSTITPTHSENADKSTNSSAEIPFLEATLQSLPENGELSHILKNLSLEQYQPIFEEQEVDLEAFMSLTDEDLVELGIQQLESRKKILGAIYTMNAKQNIQHPTSFSSQWQFLGTRKTGLDRQQECL